MTSPLEAPLFLEREMPSLYRRFEVRRFRHPTLVWINERFWREAGYSLDCEASRIGVEQDLIDRFAVTAPGPFDPVENLGPEAQWLYADRYGGPLGTLHGGSGRSGALGGLHAKGIGRTPLCSDAADWYHSHGCMWLEEAVREAVLSEVAAREFPHGASVVAAVIDTGESIYWPDGTTGERRAIAVRGAAFRVAHAERSIYFGTGGSEGSDQHLDALRVAEAIRHLESRREVRTGAWTTSKDLTNHLIRVVCDQIAFGHVHRLTHGDYYSSNLDFDGRLVDFGSFRAVPDWSRTECVPNAPRFGEEANNLVPTLKALNFYLRKYGQTLAPAPLDASSLHLHLDEACAQGRERHFERLLESCKTASTRWSIMELLTHEFSRQQQSPRSYLDSTGAPRSRDWLFRGLAGLHGSANESPGANSGIALREFALRDGGEALGARLMRWAAPRPWLDRDRLQRLIFSVQAQIGLSPHKCMPRAGALRLQRLIDRLIASSRRNFWPLHPQDVIEGYSMASGCEALHCRNADTGETFNSIRCQTVGDAVFLFGRLVSPDAIEGIVEITGRDRTSITGTVDDEGFRRLAGSSGVREIHPFAPLLRSPEGHISRQRRLRELSNAAS